jgi:hypothetical protein
MAVATNVRSLASVVAASHNASKELCMEQSFTHNGMA